jgi:hypothetical protein
VWNNERYSETCDLGRAATQVSEYRDLWHQCSRITVGYVPITAYAGAGTFQIGCPG